MSQTETPISSLRGPDSKCKKCAGTGHFTYDENHLTVCDACCTHPDGWWKMEDGYGTDNGKYACKTGCGTLIDELPIEDTLMAQTREVLAEILGREPTEKEVLRAHTGFRRMASIMYDYVSKTEREEKKKKIAEPKH